MIKKIVVTAIALVSFLTANAQAAIPEDVVKKPSSNILWKWV